MDNKCELIFHVVFSSRNSKSVKFEETSHNQMWSQDGRRYVRSSIFVYYYYYYKFCSQIEVPEHNNCRLVPY